MRHPQAVSNDRSFINQNGGASKLSMGHHMNNSASISPKKQAKANATAGVSSKLDKIYIGDQSAENAPSRTLKGKDLQTLGTFAP